MVAGQTAKTPPDKSGNFELSVEGKAGDRVELRIYRDGRQVYDGYQSLPGPVNIKLAPPLSETESGCVINYDVVSNSDAPSDGNKGRRDGEDFAI